MVKGRIMKKYKMSIIVMGLVFAMSALGCGGAQKEDSASNPQMNELSSAPDWVYKDCQQHFSNTTETGNVVCGVGYTSGITSRSLARSAAAARGRTEIARVLSVKVQSVLIDYQAAKGAADGTVSSEQQIQDMAQQVTDISLQGSRMVESWISPKGDFYALMAMNMSDFTGVLQNDSSLDPDIRNAVLNNAHKLFSDSDAESGEY